MRAHVSKADTTLLDRTADAHMGGCILLKEPCMGEVALYTTSALRWLLLAAAAAASVALNHSALLGWGTGMEEVALHTRVLQLAGAADGGGGP